MAAVRLQVQCFVSANPLMRRLFNAPLFFISQQVSGGDSVLTLEMVRGMLKSFPPCSRKPHGAGPFRVTVYVLIFCSMSTLPLRNNKLCWLCLGLSSC